MLWYVELTEAGKLYEYLMTEAGIPPHRRDEFKREFFGRVLFCKNHERYDEGKLFARLFPNVVKALVDLKRKDYTAPAKLLQRVESSLIVNRVVRRLMEARPDEFVGTIHDSVLCTRDGTDGVVAVIRREFERVGLRPTLRVDDYGLENLSQVA